MSREIRTLRYFLALVQEGSVSKAAKALYITQPTLSRQLADLEKHVGAPLYERGNKRISLTDEGMALYDYAKAIVELADRAEAELMVGSHELRGNVYIGAGEADSMRIIARVIKSLHAQHPDIRFHIYSGSTLDLLEKLDRGLFDFVLECEAASRVGYSMLKLPIPNRFGAIVHKDSPLAKLNVIRPSDLEGEVVTFSRQLIKSGVLKKWAGESFDKIEIVTTHNLLLNATYFIKEGFGCSITFDDLIDTSEGSVLRCVPIDPPIETSNALIWRKGRRLSKAAQAFLEQVRRESQAYEDSSRDS